MTPDHLPFVLMIQFDPFHPRTTLEELLSEDERERAERFVRDEDRCSFVYSRGILRYVLSLRFHLPRPKICFSYGRNGKPRLADRPSPSFNVSHAGNLVAIIIAPDGRDVGIDVEKVGPIDGVLDLARRHFCSRETAYVAAAAKLERISAFLRIWTRKEAVLKADGRGLALPLDGFDTSLGVTAREGTCVSKLGGTDAQEWTIHNIDVPPGYFGALAYSGRPKVIRIARFSMNECAGDLTTFSSKLQNFLATRTGTLAMRPRISRTGEAIFPGTLHGKFIQ